MPTHEQIRNFCQALIDSGYTRQNAREYCLMVRFSNLDADYVLAALKIASGNPSTT